MCATTEGELWAPATLRVFEPVQRAERPDRGGKLEAEHEERLSGLPSCFFGPRLRPRETAKSHPPLVADELRSALLAEGLAAFDDVVGGAGDGGEAALVVCVGV